MKPKKSYFSSGLTDESLDIFREAFSENSQNYAGAYSLISLLINQGLESEAVTVYEAYYNNLSGRGIGRELTFKAGLAYKSLKIYDRAIDAFQQVLDAGGQWADCYFHLAHCYFFLDETKKCRDNLEKSLNKNSQFVSALRLKSDLLLSEGDKDGAIELLQTINDTLSSSIIRPQRLFDYDISVHFSDEIRLQALIVQLRELCREFPDFADYHYKLGLALEANRDFKSGLDHYREALTINRNFSIARERFWKNSRAAENSSGDNSGQNG